MTVRGLGQTAGKGISYRTVLLSYDQINVGYFQSIPN
jgi:hypothetical protein